MYQFFNHKFRISDFLVFYVTFSEEVKEFRKVKFPVLINRTNLHLQFLGHQVRKKHFNIYQKSNLN